MELTQILDALAAIDSERAANDVAERARELGTRCLTRRRREPAGQQLVPEHARRVDLHLRVVLVRSVRGEKLWREVGRLGLWRLFIESLDMKSARIVDPDEPSAQSRVAGRRQPHGAGEEDRRLVVRQSLARRPRLLQNLVGADHRLGETVTDPRRLVQ